MNELNRLCALLAAHILGMQDSESYEISSEERAEVLALAQTANERGEASRGYHRRPRGQAALARAVGSPIVVQTTELVVPSSRRKDANNKA